VKEIVNHAINFPNKTLGVVAFSQSQSKLIEEYLEEELTTNPNPSVENFLFHNHENERFFVKNLENVQGDERDYIFISVGYGYQENGKFTYSFGPINKSGGERRLNVLFSRAKSKCAVFSNFRGDELDLSRTDSVGVKVLKSYLIFAERGGVEQPTSKESVTNSVFEEQIASFLKENGIDVELQVGVGGFRIDIGVKHPTEKGHYVLAIECDGDTYHSNKIARDRDKSRQVILESLGWKFYRIWSTNWFLNPISEGQNLLNYVNNILSGNEKIETSQDENLDKIRVSENEVFEKPMNRTFFYHKFEEIQEFYSPLHESFLYDLILRIIEVEEPIHKECILSRVLEVTGTKKSGSRIQSNFEVELDFALEFSKKIPQDLSVKKELKRDGDFFYFNSNLETPSKDGIIRERSNLNSRENDFKLISPFELKNGLIYLISTSYGIGFEEIINETIKMFGFKRINEDQKEILLKILNELQEKRFIVLANNVFRIP
jgi:very-short-patch-repair endonuclease